MKRHDRVLTAFLMSQQREAEALAADSDLLELFSQKTEGDPPRRFIARFHCTGLVQDPSTGVVSKASPFEVGVTFPDHHLRRVEPFFLVTILSPPSLFHPNARPPFLCLGHLTPGIGLIDILFQVYDVLTYQKVTMREDDALNHAACVWARAHRDRFPIDSRPLKWRAPVGEER